MATPNKFSIGKCKAIIRELINATDNNTKCYVNALMIGSKASGKTSIVEQLRDEMGFKLYIKNLSHFSEQSAISYVATDKEVVTYKKDNNGNIIYDIEYETHPVKIGDDIVLKKVKNEDGEYVIKSKKPVVESVDTQRLLDLYVNPFFYEMEKDLKEGHKVVLFLDEIKHGLPEVHNLFFSILAERRVTQDIIYNNNLIIIGASNHEFEDSSMTPMSIPFASRFFNKMIVKPNVSETVDFYDRNGFTTAHNILSTNPSLLNLSEDNINSVDNGKSNSMRDMNDMDGDTDISLALDGRTWAYIDRLLRADNIKNLVDDSQTIERNKSAISDKFVKPSLNDIIRTVAPAAAANLIIALMKVKQTFPIDVKGIIEGTAKFPKVDNNRGFTVTDLRKTLFAYYGEFRAYFIGSFTGVEEAFNGGMTKESMDAFDKFIDDNHEIIGRMMSFVVDIAITKGNIAAGKSLVTSLSDIEKSKISAELAETVKSLANLVYENTTDECNMSEENVYVEFFKLVFSNNVMIKILLSVITLTRVPKYNKYSKSFKAFADLDTIEITYEENGKKRKQSMLTFLNGKANVLV